MACGTGPGAPGYLQWLGERVRGLWAIYNGLGNGSGGFGLFTMACGTVPGASDNLQLVAESFRKLRTGAEFLGKWLLDTELVYFGLRARGVRVFGAVITWAGG